MSTKFGNHIWNQLFKPHFLEAPGILKLLKNILLLKILWVSDLPILEELWEFILKQHPAEPDQQKKKKFTLCHISSYSQMVQITLEESSVILPNYNGRITLELCLLHLILLQLSAFEKKIYILIFLLPLFLIASNEYFFRKKMHRKVIILLPKNIVLWISFFWPKTKKKRRKIEIF